MFLTLYLVGNFFCYLHLEILNFLVCQMTGSGDIVAGKKGVAPRTNSGPGIQCKHSTTELPGHYSTTLAPSNQPCSILLLSP